MSATTARTALVVLLPACLAAVALAASIVPASAQDDGDVTIYRCTGADGEVVIGNVPCTEGSTQQVRSMVRPLDGAPPPARAPDAAPAPASQPEVRHVVVQPPQPLYECTRPDGSVYESDSDEGEVRWVPLWSTGGWPVGGGWHGGHGGRPGGGAGGRGNIGQRGATTRAGNGLSAPPVSRISIPSDPPRPDPDAAIGPRPRPPHGGRGYVGAEPGNWERDPCQALPPAETCARLRDRREEIRRRFFNAQQRERDTLRVEERGLNARIDADCRTY